MWYAVYEISTGDLISTGSVIAEGSETESDAISRLASFGKGVTILAGDPREISQIWNGATKTFDAVATPAPHLDKQDFLSLFTDTEREDIFDAARNHSASVVRLRLQAFLDWLKIVEVVDMGDAYVGTAVTGMETVGLIGAGRAVIIMEVV